MVTVLIRTSFRPKQFLRCLESIPAGVGIVVCYDDRRAEKYIPNYVASFYVNYDKSIPFFYNLYCNDLISHCQDAGHYLILDDDDIMISQVPEIKDGISCLIPFMRGNFETPHLWARKPGFIKSGLIGMCCLILWHEHKKYVNFEATEDADYRVIKHLSACVELEWLDTPVVRSEKRNFGKMENVL